MITRLKIERLRAEATLRSFSAECGVSKTHLCRIEKRQFAASETVARKISECLNEKFWWLFEPDERGSLWATVDSREINTDPTNVIMALHYAYPEERR